MISEGAIGPERQGPLGTQADDDRYANDGQPGADETSGAGTLVLGDPQQEQRSGNVNAAVCGATLGSMSNFWLRQL